MQTPDWRHYIKVFSLTRYGTSSAAELSRSRSTHAVALKSRDSSPDRGGGGGGSDGDKEALSSWARYLKNKYGNRKETPREGPNSGSTASSYGSSSTATTTPSSTSASSSSRRLSLGLPLRQANESLDDDSKNLLSSLASPTQVHPQVRST